MMRWRPSTITTTSDRESLAISRFMLLLWSTCAEESDIPHRRYCGPSISRCTSLTPSLSPHLSLSLSLSLSFPLGGGARCWYVNSGVSHVLQIVAVVTEETGLSLKKLSLRLCLLSLPLPLSFCPSPSLPPSLALHDSVLCLSTDIHSLLVNNFPPPPPAPPPLARARARARSFSLTLSFVTS